MATIQSLSLANTFAELLATVNTVIHELNTNVLKIGDIIDSNTESVIIIAEQVVTDTLTVGTTADLRGDVTANANVSVAGTLTTNRLFVIANATVNTLVVNTTINTNNVIAALALSAGVSANVGANVSLSVSSLLIGNSTVNTTHNSSTLAFNGTLIANSSVVNIPTLNAPAVNASTLVVSTSAAVGANVILGVADLKVGNSTVNTTHNSSSLAFNGTLVANSSVVNIPTINAATHNGASLVLSTSAAVGANIVINTSALLIGNTTVNAVMNSSVLTIAAVSGGLVLPVGKTITANGGTGNSGTVLMSTGTDAFWGTVVGGSGAGGDGSLQYWSTGSSAVTSSANLVFNGTLLTLGNSTVKSTVNSTTFITGGFVANTTIVGMGANVALNSSALFVGNSTVNASMTSTRLAFNGTATVVNSTVYTGTSYFSNNSTYLNGQLESFYRDASNMNGGTLPVGRLTGEYTGIVNIGTLGILNVSGNTTIGQNVFQTQVSTGKVFVGNTAANSSVTDSLLSVRRSGSSIEFGAANDGFQCAVGAQFDGTPFVAFNCESGTNNNTYRTRGTRLGNVLRGESGNLMFGYISSAATNNQTPLELMRISGSAGSIAANAILRCDTTAGRMVLPVGTNKYAT